MLLLVRVAVFVAIWSCSSLRISGLRTTRFVLKIPPRSRECFYESVTREDSELDVAVHVLKSGYFDLGVEIYCPEEQGRLSATVRRGETNLKLTLSGKNEPCKICLDNSFGLLAEKVVRFTVLVYENRDYNAGASVLGVNSTNYSNSQAQPRALNVTDMEHRLARLTWLLFNVTSAQNSLKDLGARDWSAAVSANRQVMMWSVLEVLVIVFACLVQVIALTSTHRLLHNRGQSSECAHSVHMKQH